MKKILGTVCFLLMIKIGFSQTTFNDAMSWLSVGVDEKINDKFSAKFFTRLRVGENFTQLNSWYSDFGVKYTINNHWNLTVDYVYTPARQSNFLFRPFHQYYGSLNYKTKIVKHVDFGNRIIIQRTSSGDILDSGDPSKNSIDLREKCGFDYKINKKYSAFSADEILIPITNSIKEIRRNRFYAGINRNINKYVDCDFYFVLQSSYHSSSQNYRYYIYGFDLNYKLMNWKKIKKHIAKFHA